MTIEHSSLQFGIPEVGVVYRARPAAFGVGEEAGRIALVRVTVEGSKPWFDLPGGAIEANESARDAVIREFGEETGLRIEAGQAYARADQHFRLTDDSPVNNLCTFFEVRLNGVQPGLKIEDDHELVWRDPLEALRLLRHDAHAWALTAWLRRRGIASG